MSSTKMLTLTFRIITLMDDEDKKSWMVKRMWARSDMDKTKDDICERHDVNDQQGGEEVDDAIIDGDRDWVFAISSSGGGGEAEIVFLGINLELLLLVIIMIILLVEIKKILNSPIQ